MRAQEHEIAWLAEYDIIGGAFPLYVDKRRPGPAFQNRSISLPKAPLSIALDTERFE